MTSVASISDDLRLALIAGTFALGGVLLGGGVNAFAAWRQRVAEDKRRWLSDRRNLYANFLGLVSSMLQEIDSMAVLMRYEEGSAAPSHADLLKLNEALFEFHARWNEELQPALGEIQLLADERVAELADEMSHALLELTGYVDPESSFTDYHPSQLLARDMSKVLRNSMREELGLVALRGSEAATASMGQN